MSSSSSLSAHEILCEVQLHAFNLDTNSEAKESLQALLTTEYPLDLLKDSEIRKLTGKYVASRHLGNIARAVIRKIDDLETKEAHKKDRKRVHSLSSSSTSSGNSSDGMTASPPEQKKRCPEQLKKISAPPLPEFLISSKRTMPIKFVPKNKGPVQMTPVLRNIPTQAISTKSQKNNKEEMERLQKYQERKRAERQEEAKKKQEAAKEGVAKVMSAYESAREERIRKAQEAKRTGVWKEEKPKKCHKRIN